MSWLRPLVALLLTCSASLATAAASELRPFQASYAISWGRISAGSSQLSLQRLGDGRWTYQSSTSTRMLFRLVMPAELSSRSTFSVQNEHVVPQQFTADDGAGSSDKQQLLNFDWVRGRVTGTFERKPVDLPTQPGLLDSMSVHVAVMQELLAGRTPQRIVLVDKGRIKDYIFSMEGTDTLQTAVGAQQVVIFKRSRPGSKNSIWFWCAPELGYVPLKVEQREGKDVELSMSVKSLTFDEAG